VVLVAPLPPDASRHKEQAMAVDRADRPRRIGLVISLVRSLLLLALAALAILGLLPAVVAAQAAATL